MHLWGKERWRDGVGVRAQLLRGQGLTEQKLAPDLSSGFGRPGLWLLDPLPHPF